MVGGSYKQQCPSCEAMVLVKSPALVGKKIECPKCKDRFIVAGPAPVKKPIDDEEEDSIEEEQEVEAPPPPRSDKLKAGKPPVKKPPVKVRDEEEADEDQDAEPDSDAEMKPAKPELRVKSGAPGKKPPMKLRDAEGEDEYHEESKPAKGKAKPVEKPRKGVKPQVKVQEEEQPAADEGEGEEGQKPKKKGLSLKGLSFKGLSFKFNFGNKKMALGLGLAVVGVVVLGAAAYFILGGSPNNVKKNFPNVRGPGPGPQPGPAGDKKNPGKDGKDPKDAKTISGKDGKDAKKDGEVPVVNIDLVPPGPELTNLFPPDTEQIVRINCKALFDLNGPFYDAMFNAFTVAGPFSEDLFKQRLGFNVTKINEIYQAERFSGVPWSLTVIHVNETLDMGKIAKALGAVPQKAIKNEVYYQVIGNNWLEQLGRLGPGVPPSLRYLAPSREGRPLLIYRHNHQTLVVGDDEPMKAFLNVERQFRFYADKIDPKKPVDPKKVDPTVRGGTYMTVKPELKNLIEKSYPFDEGLHAILFSSGTELAAAQTTSKLPQNRGLLLCRPRPFWDITCMLEERKPRLKWGSASLIIKDNRKFQYRTELTCNDDMEAKELSKELADLTIPRLFQLAEQILEYKIELPTLDGKQSNTPSRSALVLKGPAVGFTMDLAMDTAIFGRATELFSLLMVDARAELALWEGGDLRAQLARAVNQVGVKGLEKRNAPGTFPPATFPRPGKDRMARDPGLRISWMASLLPFLGQEKLYERIMFESSWQDPLNVLAGRTTVAQFLDPSYPEWSRSVAYPDLLAEYGATHFVGVAGVGLDAAEYPLGHPKRGILGYDQSASLAEVQKGRGLSNTMLMIQVPPDGVGGVTPWIAGGGSTLRGIPESKSIEPFVLTRDRYQKPMQHKGQAGTYAVMADGSVRFISSKASDSVVQAMATYLDGTKVDLDKDGDTPKVSDPIAEKKEKEKEKKDKK